MVTPRYLALVVYLSTWPWVSFLDWISLLPLIGYSDVFAVIWVKKAFASPSPIPVDRQDLAVMTLHLPALR